MKKEKKTLVEMMTSYRMVMGFETTIKEMWQKESNVEDENGKISHEITRLIKYNLKSCKLYLVIRKY